MTTGVSGCTICRSMIGVRSRNVEISSARITPSNDAPPALPNRPPTSARNPHVLIGESTADHHRSGGHGRIARRRRGSARARDIRVDHESVRTLAGAVRRGESGPAASALPELSPGRRASDAGQRQPSAFPAGDSRSRRQGRHRLALHDLPPECELRAFGRSGSCSVACRTEVDGMADEIAGSDLRADQGPARSRPACGRSTTSWWAGAGCPAETATPRPARRRSWAR